MLSRIDFLYPSCDGFVLDFGGVITQTLFETHTQTETALGLPPSSLHWKGPFDPATDSLWRQMTAGEISERAYWLHRAKETGTLIGKEWTEISDFVIAARSASPDQIIRPEFLHVFKKIRQQGKKTAILSNELDLFYGADFREKLPFMNQFDVIIDATYTQILKPDPRAYKAVCDELSLGADRLVFLDDQYRNVQGALDFGMHAVHFDVTMPQKSYDEAFHYLSNERI